MGQRTVESSEANLPTAAGLFIADRVDAFSDELLSEDSPPCHAISALLRRSAINHYATQAVCVGRRHYLCQPLPTAADPLLALMVDCRNSDRCGNSGCTFVGQSAPGCFNWLITRRSWFESCGRTSQTTFVSCGAFFC